MNRKKGFTLIEIIISIALLGIIALALLPAITVNFKLLVNTKKITRDTFRAQQEIELAIEEAKAEFKGGSTPGGDIIEYTLFSEPYQRTVKGYSKTVNINNTPDGAGNSNRQIYTIIADTRVPDFEVATAENVAIKMYVYNVEKKNAYSIMPSLTIKSQATIYDPKFVNITNLHQWYVSREGFNIPMIQNSEEIEKGTVYPRFPDDYFIIPSATSSELTSIILKNYPGRHILYTITPASGSGKMGATIPSSPLFISGLPVIDNLELHLDASIVTDVFTDKYGSDIYLNGWKDLLDNQYSVAQNAKSHGPRLIQESFGVFKDSNGVEHEAYAKFLSFDSQRYLSVDKELNDFTVFVVARINDNAVNKSIISNKNGSKNYWRLGWNESNKLEFSIKDNKTENQVINDTNEGLDRQWHILTASTLLSIQVDDKPLNTLRRTATGSINNKMPIKIGGAKVDIAEIIIYSSISDTDRAKVYNYLKNKYCK